MKINRIMSNFNIQYFIINYKLTFLCNVYEMVNDFYVVIAYA